jgi:hypothetical protein
MRIFTRGLTVALGLAASGLMISEAQAVPAFARQTGMACSSCHFQNFPSLNSFGRVFKAQGYTMRGAAPLIEGDKLSMPADLKATVITKVRYKLSETNDGGRGAIQWPDEAAIIVGGRAAENAGYLMELGLTGQDLEASGTADTGTGALTCTNPADATTCTADTGTGATDVTGATHGAFFSSKFQFNVTNEFAVIPFSTDAAGVAYGFELLNTGMQRNMRPIESRTTMSAYQTTGLGSGKATGIGFVYHTPTYYVNYTHWAPTWGEVNANILGGLASYVRAAYTPNIGGWDTAFAASWLGGSIDHGATDPASTINVKGWGVDAQAQGQFGSMPAGFYVSYAVAPKGTVADPQFYNGSTTDDVKAYAGLATLGVLPGTVELYAAYNSTDSGAATKNNEATVGAILNAAQNIKFELFTVNSNQTGADYSMIEMFAAF